jgi:hypothetical protein
MYRTRKHLKALTVFAGISLGAQATPFGGEVLLSSYWYDWHHNALTRTAAQQAGFFRILGSIEKPKEDEIDSASAEIGWHASFVDSYAYNPLFWAMRGTRGYTTAVALHDDLIKVHYDDTNSTPQVRQTIFRYTTGTLTGLLWAKSIYRRGERMRAIAAARQILGISLHANQDFYSHSNWIDLPARRTKTWFEEFTTNPTGLVNTQMYTGAYELPEQTSVHSHGIMSPSISAMQAIAPIMDLLASDISPVRESATFVTWRKYKNRSEPIMPGIIDSAAFGNSGPAQTEAGIALAALTARPSQMYIGMPPNTLFVAPPGMAIDASYLAAIACRERGIIDTTPVKAFISAYSCALNSSAQWLRRIDQVMKDQFSADDDFWFQVKNAPPTNQHHEMYEDFNNLAFKFLSAGNYPEDAAVTQANLGGDASKVPATEYFLRLKIKTSSDILSGTDADIYAEVDGKRYLLDYGNVANKGFADAIFAYNDFEGGMTTAYTVGPFATPPAALKLVNQAGDIGQVMTAIGQSIVNGFTSIGVAIADFFQMITGAKPDYIGENRLVWSAQQLAAVTTTGYEQKVYINGGDEGRYDVFVHIKKLSSANGQSTFRITPKRFKCLKESTLDQIGSTPGDEVFLCNVVTGFPGTPAGNRTPVYRETRTGNEKTIVDLNIDVTVPDRYGAITYGVMMMESDSEFSAARDTIQEQYQGKLDLPTTKKTSILNEIGRAFAADWKMESLEVTGFTRGAQMGVGVMYSGTPNSWIEGNKSQEFILNRTALTAQYSDSLHLQKMDQSNSPTGPVKEQIIIKDLPVRPGTVVKLPPKEPANPPNTPGVGQDATDLGKILLVDDNRDDSNALDGVERSVTTADKMYRDLLAAEGLKFDVELVQTYKDGPSLDKLSQYDTVIWYVGGGYNEELTGNDRTTVRAWVMSGKKNLYMFAPGFINALSYDSTAKSYLERWQSCDNSLMSKVFGLKGGSGMISRFIEGDMQDADTRDLYMVGKGSETETIFSPLNPASGTRPLLLFECLPHMDTKTKQMNPVATVSRTGTSYCTYVAFTLENLLINRQKLFHKLLFARP